MYLKNVPRTFLTCTDLCALSAGIPADQRHVCKRLTEKDLVQDGQDVAGVVAPLEGVQCRPLAGLLQPVAHPAGETADTQVKLSQSTLHVSLLLFTVGGRAQAGAVVLQDLSRRAAAYETLIWEVGNEREREAAVSRREDGRVLCRCVSVRVCVYMYNV